jgi:hypothetical protein
MKVLIEMRANQYDRLLRACHRESPEFRILMSAWIDERANEEQLERVAKILCDTDDVKYLFALANRTSWGAARTIIKALRVLREK